MPRMTTKTPTRSQLTCTALSSIAFPAAICAARPTQGRRSASMCATILRPPPSLRGPCRRCRPKPRSPRWARYGFSCQTCTSATLRWSCWRRGGAAAARAVTVRGGCGSRARAARKRHCLCRKSQRWSGRRWRRRGRWRARCTAGRRCACLAMRVTRRRRRLVKSRTLSRRRVRVRIARARLPPRMQRRPTRL